MQLLISDANILIDMEEGQLLALMFKLPFEFRIPDLLFYDELEELHSHWLDQGLQLGTLSGDSVRRVSQLTRRYPKPSRNDCMALVLAQQEQCPLLTGDRHLRQAAEKEGLLVMGTLWLVEQLLVQHLITADEAKYSYQRMKDNGRRLPWEMAFQRLQNLQEEI
jgi:predicted nucleic acid-binding protein